MDSETNKFGKDTEEEKKKRRHVLMEYRLKIFLLFFILYCLLVLFGTLPHGWSAPIYTALLAFLFLSLLLIEICCDDLATTWIFALSAALSLATGIFAWVLSR